MNYIVYDFIPFILLVITIAFLGVSQNTKWTGLICAIVAIVLDVTFDYLMRGFTDTEATVFYIYVLTTWLLIRILFLFGFVIAFKQSTIFNPTNGSAWKQTGFPAHLIVILLLGLGLFMKYREIVLENELMKQLLDAFYSYDFWGIYTNDSSLENKSKMAIAIAHVCEIGAPTVYMICYILKSNKIKKSQMV